MAEIKKRGPKSEPRLPVPLEGTPKPPAHLSKLAKSRFNQLVEDLQESGNLSRLDFYSLEIYCSTWADWVEAQRMVTEQGAVLMTSNGTAYPNPWYKIANDKGRQLKSYLDHFGLSPKARTVVKPVEKADIDNKWSDFES